MEQLIFYPLDSKLQPTKAHLVNFGPNFNLVSIGLWMNALHPKTQKCIIEGFFLPHTSFGVFWLKYFWGFQPLMSIIMLLLSTQNFELNLSCWCIMQRVALLMVRIFLWTKPFCYDVYGIKVWCIIPWVLKKSPNSCKQCSPLLSILNIFTFFSIYVSTRLLNFWNFETHSLLREKLTKRF